MDLRGGTVDRLKSGGDTIKESKNSESGLTFAFSVLSSAGVKTLKHLPSNGEHTCLGFVWLTTAAGASNKIVITILVAGRTAKLFFMSE